MNKIKSKIQQLQISRAMNKINNQHNEDEEEDEEIINEEEIILRNQIETEKELYKKYYLSLKNIKGLLYYNIYIYYIFNII